MGRHFRRFFCQCKEWQDSSGSHAGDVWQLSFRRRRSCDKFAALAEWEAPTNSEQHFSCGDSVACPWSWWPFVDESDVPGTYRSRLSGPQLEKIHWAAGLCRFQPEEGRSRRLRRCSGSGRRKVALWPPDQWDYRRKWSSDSTWHSDVARGTSRATWKDSLDRAYADAGGLPHEEEWSKRCAEAATERGYFWNHRGVQDPWKSPRCPKAIRI